ncbi:MAG: flagellar basal body L-ring protein FlgH [Pseudomonadota bacterium]
MSLILMGLSACNALERFASIGEAPPLSAPQDPTRQPTYKPLTMPMPNPKVPVHSSNSLWRTGSKSFFKDLRAKQVGDIVTVIVNITDQATINNQTNHSREGDFDTGITGLLGFENNLRDILPERVNPANLVGIDSESTNSGNGTIARQENINLQVAAVVTQLLPNGNLVLHGRQETRVNFEVRELQVAGVIRPQDITNENTVDYSDIAEARVSYGGRGQITDLQQPRYGAQIADIILPF